MLVPQSLDSSRVQLIFLKFKLQESPSMTQNLQHLTLFSSMVTSQPLLNPIMTHTLRVDNTPGLIGKLTFRIRQCSMLELYLI